MLARYFFEGLIRDSTRHHLILATFGLFAPRNATALLTLMVCSLAISSSIYLILELGRPFRGMIQVASTPLRDALALLGR